MRKDPLLWFADPIFRDDSKSRALNAQADEIDREIDKIIADARFKSAVVAAKAEIIDDLRRLLEAHNG